MSRALSYGIVLIFALTMNRSKQAIELPGGARIGGRNRPTIRIDNISDFAARILHDGALGFGEAFLLESWRGGEMADPSLQDETDGVADWLAVYGRRLLKLEKYTSRLPAILWHWRLPQSVTNNLLGAKKNVEAHYNLSPEFFATFLDSSLTYSSAVFERRRSVHGGGSLDELHRAQIMKIDQILDLAGVAPGSKLLDIGCGWGFLAAYAAKTRSVEVVGLTISSEQAQVATDLALGWGVSDRVTILQEDYRSHTGTYDAVVSVEMIEAVGQDYWPSFFAALDRLGAPGSTVVLQATTLPQHRLKKAANGYSWIQRYIFPGGQLISIEELDRLTRRHTRFEAGTRRLISDSYARTLRIWRAEFCANLERVHALGFDGRFSRLWALYLAYFEGAFRASYLDAWQIQLRCHD